MCKKNNVGTHIYIDFTLMNTIDVNRVAGSKYPDIFYSPPHKKKN